MRPESARIERFTVACFTANEEIPREKGFNFSAAGVTGCLYCAGSIHLPEPADRPGFVPYWLAVTDITPVFQRLPDFILRNLLLQAGSPLCVDFFAHSGWYVHLAIDLIAKRQNILTLPDFPGGSSVIAKPATRSCLTLKTGLIERAGYDSLQRMMYFVISHITKDIS